MAALTVPPLDPATHDLYEVAALALLFDVERGNFGCTHRPERTD